MGTSGIGMTAGYQLTGMLLRGVKVHLYATSCDKTIYGLDSLEESLVFSIVKLPIRLLGSNRAAVLHDRIAAKILRRTHKNVRVDLVHC
jgi:hypothetical protein